LFLKLSKQWSSLNKQQQEQIRLLIVSSILSSHSHTVEKLCQCLSILTLNKILEMDVDDNKDSGHLNSRKLFSFFSLPNVTMDIMGENTTTTTATSTDIHHVINPFLKWLSHIAERTRLDYYDNHE
jgi:hypothetical protein